MRNRANNDGCVSDDPAHTMTTLVVAGAVLGGLGWYESLVEFAGTGATTQSAVLEIHCLRALWQKHKPMA